MSSIKKDIAYDANSKAIGKYFDFINTSLGTIFSQLKIEVTNKINKIPYWLSKIELENYKIDELLIPFTAKIKEQSRLKEISEKAIAENIKLKNSLKKKMKLKSRLILE
jgi:hypothetical protein